MSELLETVDEASDGGLPRRSCSRPSEIQRLRALFPEILKNLKSGACVADCSLEFLEQIPNEVKLVIGRHERELKYAAIEIAELRHQIRETIMENLHLADGDDCTLKRLKDAISFELEDSSENARAMPPDAIEKPLK